MTDTSLSVFLITYSSHTAHLLSERIRSSFEGDIRISSAVGVHEACKQLSEESVDLILLATISTSKALNQDLASVRRAFPLVPIMVVLDEFSDELALDLLQNGAQDVVLSRILEWPNLKNKIWIALARQQAVNKLIAAGDNGQGLCGCTPQIIVETDLDFYITFWNRLSAAEKLGTTWDLKPGYNILDFLSLEDRKRALQHIEQLFKGAELGVVEYIAHNRNGAEFPIFVELSPVYVDDTPTGVRFAVLDLSQQRRAQAELRRIEEQLMRSQKLEAVGLMTAGVAHDLNNILAVISAITSSLTEELDNDSSLSEDLAGVAKACLRGGELTRSLMSFVREQPDRKARFSVNNQVREIEFLLSTTMEKKIRIDVEMETGPTFVHGNASQLNHALMNICLNSLKAMTGGGTLTLTTRRTHLTPATLPDGITLVPGNYVVVEVTDTGVGMDEPTRDRAFEPFFTTTANEGGTGLGLMTVANTVKEHRGAVSLDSLEGQGTKVTVYLPADDRRTTLPPGDYFPSKIPATPAVESQGPKPSTAVPPEPEERPSGTHYLRKSLSSIPAPPVVYPEITD